MTTVCPSTVARDKAALKAGIPASQFSAVVGGFYEGLVEKGMAPAPYNPDAERSALMRQPIRYSSPSLITT